jgi:hypothetical protein
MYGIAKCDEIIRLIDDVLRDNDPSQEPARLVDNRHGLASNNEPITAGSAPGVTEINRTAVAA